MSNAVISSLKTLEIIKADIQQSPNLVLNERILEQKVLDSLKRSFHWRQDYSLSVSNIQNVRGDNKYLSFSGTLDHFYTFHNISVTFCLFEPAELPGERHAAFRINLPEPFKADSYLSQYSLALDVSSSSAITFNPNLANYLDNINFANPKVIIFSSLDYSENDNQTYPKLSQEQVIPAEITEKKLEKGINFIADITLDNNISQYLYAINHHELTTYFDKILQEDSSSSQSQILTHQSQCFCAIYLIEYYNADKDVNEYIPHLKIRLKPENITSQEISFLNLKYHEISLVIPLVKGYESEVQILIDGVVKITIDGKSGTFDVKGTIETYYHHLLLSFSNFPTLQQLINLVEPNPTEASLANNYFPEPLNSLLKIKLTELRMGLSLGNQSIFQIGFSLTTQDELYLVEDVISLKPSLSMNIYNPLEAEYRSVEGELKGTWQLGKTEFITSLNYPSFSFHAGMVKDENQKDQTLDLDALVTLLLPGVLPTNSHITLTKMDLYGNFTAKTFSAEFAVDTQSLWKFKLGKKDFTLDNIGMRMTYAQEGNFYAMDGHLTLDKTIIFISAEYYAADAAQGWRLFGGTAAESTINLSNIIHDLLESLSLPDQFPNDLELKNVIFSAAPKIGEYSLSGQTAKDWHLTDKLILSVEQFAAKKSQNVSVYGTIRVVITISDIIVRLSAEKSATTGGGWQFEGSTWPGQNIPIGTLITWLAEKFGATSVPDSIKNCTIKNLKIAFNAGSKDFTFTCEATVPLPDLNTEIDGTIIIDIKYQKEDSFTKLFSGTLVIDDLDFALIFEASGKATGETSKTFIAAYHDPKGREIPIDGLIKKLFNADVSTGLTVSIKDVLFAYQSQTTSTNFLLGADIEAGLNLSDLKLPDLPLIGAPFPPDQNLKLGMQVFYTKSEFSVDEVNKLNTLDSNGLKLPQQGIKQGFNLVALLRVGQDTKSLTLPIGLDTKKGQGLVGTSSDSPSNVVSNSAQPKPSDNITNAPSSSGSPQWVTIQKTFGPIHLERVGVGYQNSKLQCLLDASLTAAGLTLSLDGLGAEFSLSDLNKATFNPTFDLKGLGIDYRNDPLEIGGAFLKQTVKPQNGAEYTAYAGIAVIRTEKLSLTAIGSYSSYNGHPSLYIYAVLNYPLGGPPFFYITGFAAGFGYNRSLTIPTIDNIVTFPLVEEATKGDAPQPSADVPASPPGAPSSSALADTITAKLQKLENYIQPSVGDIFIAAGIKFTTFKQVNSFALLIVKFGQRFEIDLLGLSTLVAPPTEVNGGNDPVAEVQLALKATFIPDEGFLSIQAQLTPNSYILSKACHLTGGFAFFSWFKKHPSGAEAGDFVITLGGYHPKFIVPKHYPIVPRLGINWQVNKPDDPYELVIKGQAYFALTAQALMAGGNLEALWSCTWQEGTLKAWFKAGADFIITWQPYHYDASFYIDIGASYTFKILGYTNTISVDVGADLHIWGPEFAGTAAIHLKIISVKVDFGDQTSKGLEPINWDTFKQSFLPKEEQICSINVQKGLIRQIKDGAEDRWIVNPKDFVFATNSVIPSSEAHLVHPTPPDVKPTPPDVEPTRLPNATDQPNLAIASMDIEANITSKQMITITYEGTDVSDRFKFEPISKMVPAALWGKPNHKDGKLIPPDLNAKQFVENTLSGFEIRPANPPTEGSKVPQNELQKPSESKPDAFSWSNFDLNDQHKVTKVSIKTIQDSVVANSSRDDLLKALGWVNPEIDFGEPIQQSLSVTA